MSPSPSSPRITLAGVVVLFLGIAAWQIVGIDASGDAIARAHAWSQGVFAHLPSSVGLLLIASAWLLLPFIRGPLAVMQQTRQSLPKLHPVDVQKLPKLVLARLLASSAVVTRLGFVAHQCFEVRMSQRNLIYSWLHWHEGAQEMFYVSVFVRPETGVVFSALDEFISYFQDDGRVQTNASAILPVFRPNPRWQTHRLPQINDLRMLHRAHQKLSRRSQLGMRCSFGSNVETQPLFEQGLRSAYEYNLGTGFFRRDEGSSDLVPTLLGACAMAWGLTFPVKPIRRARARAAQQRTMATLDEVA